MGDKVVTFLTKAKTLIKSGKRRFSTRKYPDGKNYIDKLFEDFGITVDVAWSHILSLQRGELVQDSKFNYQKDSEAYVFKRLVNNSMAYIKIKIEKQIETEECVCISFHADQ